MFQKLRELFPFFLKQLQFTELYMKKKIILAVLLSSILVSSYGDDETKKYQDKEKIRQNTEELKNKLRKEGLSEVEIARVMEKREEAIKSNANKPEYSIVLDEAILTEQFRNKLRDEGKTSREIDLIINSREAERLRIEDLGEIGQARRLEIMKERLKTEGKSTFEIEDIIRKQEEEKINLHKTSELKI
jgi:hypothetical protein